jgi:hypothetical protein
MRLLFKTEYALRTVVRLVNICNCFSVYDWTAKLIERLLDMTSIGMLLDASVSPEKHKVLSAYSVLKSSLIDDWSLEI